MKILKTVIFEPAKDITAYEIALIVANLSGPYIQLCNEDLIKLFLKTEMKRHFKEDDGRPDGGSIFSNE